MKQTKNVNVFSVLWFIVQTSENTFGICCTLCGIQGRELFPKINLEMVSLSIKMTLPMTTF